MKHSVNHNYKITKNIKFSLTKIYQLKIKIFQFNTSIIIIQISIRQINKLKVIKIFLKEIHNHLIKIQKINLMIRNLNQ